jgi:hypothetical protein
VISACDPHVRRGVPIREQSGYRQRRGRGLELATWAPPIAKHIAVEYPAIALNLIRGVVMLPFNVRHLGHAAYGLWILVTSLAA